MGEKANSFQRGRKHQTCLIFLHAKHTHPGARALDRCHYNQSTICLPIIPVASGWAYDPFRKYILLVVSDRPLKPYEKTKYRLLTSILRNIVAYLVVVFHFVGQFLASFVLPYFPKPEVGVNSELVRTAHSPFPSFRTKKYILVMDSGVHKFPSTPQPIKIAHLFSFIQSGSLVRTELSV